MNNPNFASWNQVRAFRFSGVGVYFSCAVVPGSAAMAVANSTVAITIDRAHVTIFMSISIGKPHLGLGSNGWILANACGSRVKLQSRLPLFKQLSSRELPQPVASAPPTLASAHLARHILRFGV